MLTACDIGYSIGSKRLLDGVSLQITPGKLTAVIGPNGAGKTTLLRLFTGEIKPAAGEISLDGKPLAQWQRIERARRIGVLPQSTVMHFPMAVIDVVLLGRAPHIARRENESDFSIARAALEAVDSAHLAGRIYPSLSGGEKSRVQTARVLAQIWNSNGPGKNRFLLLDEPTAALDWTHQHSLLGFARKFAAQGVGVLAILHDLNLAAEYADEVILLADGKVAASGTPSSVLTPEILQDVFRVETLVIPHPRHEHPLVFSAGSPVEAEVSP